jgi:hypothetical protein
METKPEEQNRNKAFKRNYDLERLLSILNDALPSADELLCEEQIGERDFPIIFVMGPLRSGTTLFMQWLANTGLVAYPTNLLSRFYGAPIVGAYIQRMLLDPKFNFRDELLDFQNPITFSSENGKTKGAAAPNEFWYFWRRFLPFGETDWLPDKELMKVVDKDRMVTELSSLTRVFQKPFAMKAMILNYNIAFLNEIFEKALFVQIKRDPATNVASILEARKRQLGSTSSWYSFKIPEYSELQGLDPVTQSAGQLYFINKAVTAGITKVAGHRKLIVEYECFCERPALVFSSLCEKLGLEGKEYSGPTSFRISRTLDRNMRSEIEVALAQFPGM